MPEHRRTPVAELLTRVNHGLLIGNFETDPDDGERADVSQALATVCRDG